MAEPVATSQLPSAATANASPPAEAESARVSLPAQTQPGSAPEPETAFWMRRSDQIVLAVLCGLLVLLSASHWARLSGWGLRELEIERHPSREYEYGLSLGVQFRVEARVEFAVAA